MQKSFVYILIILIAVSCSQPPEKPAVAKEPANTNTVTLTDAQVKNASIETDSVQSQTLNAVLKVNGVVDVPPQNIVSVSFPLGGYLKNTTLLTGMHVSKGE